MTFADTFAGLIKKLSGRTAIKTSADLQKLRGEAEACIADARRDEAAAIDHRQRALLGTEAEIAAADKIVAASRLAIERATEALNEIDRRLAAAGQAEAAQRARDAVERAGKLTAELADVARKVDLSVAELEGLLARRRAIVDELGAASGVDIGSYALHGMTVPSAGASDYEAVASLMGRIIAAGRFDADADRVRTMFFSGDIASPPPLLHLDAPGAAGL